MSEIVSIRIMAFVIVILQYGLMPIFRELLYDCLLARTNRAKARKLHLAQTRRDRITLSYIEKYTIYKKQFKKIYLMRSIYFFSSIIGDIIVITTAFVPNKRFLVASYVSMGVMILAEVVWIFWLNTYYVNGFTGASIFSKCSKKYSKRK